MHVPFSSNITTFLKMEDLSFMILVFTLTALFAGYFIKFKTSLGKKLPPGSFGLPLIGESISFIRAQKQDGSDEWIRSRIRKYGPVFKTSLMGSKTVVITGQAGNRFVFGGGDTGIGGNQVATVASILGKQSIFELSGSRHKLVRSAITNFLKPENIQRIVGETDLLIKDQIFKVTLILHMMILHDISHITLISISVAGTSRQGYSATSAFGEEINIQGYLQFVFWTTRRQRQRCIV